MEDKFGKGKSLIICEDNDFLRKVFTDILVYNHGFEVYDFALPEDLLSEIKNPLNLVNLFNTDAMILDYNYGQHSEYNGQQLLRNLREKKFTMPAILITSDDQKICLDRRINLEGIFDSVLIKPQQNEKIGEELEKIIENSKKCQTNNYSHSQ